MLDFLDCDGFLMNNYYKVVIWIINIKVKIYVKMISNSINWYYNILFGMGYLLKLKWIKVNYN